MKNFNEKTIFYISVFALIVIFILGLVFSGGDSHKGVEQLSELTKKQLNIFK